MSTVTAMEYDEIEMWLGRNPDWSLEDNKLKRKIVFADFNEAFAFMMQLAEAMEAQNHHAEIYNLYNCVALAMNTHSAGNTVTEKDITLAEAVNGLLERK